MKILVNVPFLKPHKKFLPHFIQWYGETCKRHELILNFQMYRALHKVLADSVRIAKENDCTHILYTEDDHYRFPIDGIDVLAGYNKDVIGFCTYKKTYPFHPLNMKKKDPAISLLAKERNLTPFSGREGIAKTDLLSWAFTLVKVDVFDRLTCDPFEVWGFSPNDSYFCQACEDVGIDRWVCFDYQIPHGDVTPEEIPYRKKVFEAMNAAYHRFGASDVVDDEGHLVTTVITEEDRLAIQQEAMSREVTCES